jgi:SSS family solute:Na+ symporter
MLGISLFDWIVLFAYFIGITDVGLWTYKKIKSSADYFMGNRRFGKILMIVQAFGVGTHTDQPVSVAVASYTTGLAGKGTGITIEGITGGV